MTYASPSSHRRSTRTQRRYTPRTPSTESRARRRRAERERRGALGGDEGRREGERRDRKILPFFGAQFSKAHRRVFRPLSRAGRYASDRRGAVITAGHTRVRLSGKRMAALASADGYRPRAEIRTLSHPVAENGDPVDADDLAPATCLRIAATWRSARDGSRTMIATRTLTRGGANRAARRCASSSRVLRLDEAIIVGRARCSGRDLVPRLRQPVEPPRPAGAVRLREASSPDRTDATSASLLTHERLCSRRSSLIRRRAVRSFSFRSTETILRLFTPRPALTLRIIASTTSTADGSSRNN